MTARTPARVAIEEVLADGEWHSLDELIQVAAPLIPAFAAERVALRDRVRTSQTYGREPRSASNPGPQAMDAITVGRRAVARNIIKKAAYERSEDRRMVRRNPTTQPETEPK